MAEVDNQHKLEEKDGGEMVSRDRLLQVDPKKRTGRLTVKGRQIEPDKSEVEGSDPEKEN
jgi:hypothetical protein